MHNIFRGYILINISVLAGLKKRKQKILTQHPNILPFFKNFASDFIKAGNVLNISMKNEKGATIDTEIVLTEHDVETLKLIIR